MPLDHSLPICVSNGDTGGYTVFSEDLLHVRFPYVMELKLFICI